MDNDERLPFEESLAQAFREIKLMEAGLMPKHTWDELKAELEKEFAEELEEERRQELHGNNLVETF